MPRQWAPKKTPASNSPTTAGIFSLENISPKIFAAVKIAKNWKRRWCDSICCSKHSGIEFEIRGQTNKSSRGEEGEPLPSGNLLFSLYNVKL